MTSFFTVGYQGHNIETFLDLLLANSVAHIIDVRQLPFSRKADFSKKRLTAHLANVGIGYTHLVALGTPKPLRDDLRRDHDYAAFFANMEALIAMQPDAIASALELIKAQPSALLCFEAKVEECHRLTVAQAIERHANAPGAVIHL